MNARKSPSLQLILRTAYKVKSRKKANKKFLIGKHKQNYALKE